MAAPFRCTAVPRCPTAAGRSGATVFGFFKKPSADEALPETPLGAAVRRAMPGADAETLAIVTSIAGLLGQVAYADRSFSDVEERAIRDELARIHGLDRAGIDAICVALRAHILDISAVEATWYARLLRETCDRELRLEVLQALVDLAAADEDVTLGEANVLRRTATSLGLSQEEYNQAQAAHRDKLSVLR